MPEEEQNEMLDELEAEVRDLKEVIKALREGRDGKWKADPSGYICDMDGNAVVFGGTYSSACKIVGAHNAVL